MDNKIIPIYEPDITEIEKKYIYDAINTGWISSQGEYIIHFEKSFSKLFNSKYGIATSNCTTALHLSLVALGIGNGDEVICTNLTFISPVNMIEITGAQPVLVDVEEETWNIDPNKIVSKITERTKAIIVVHAFGHSANMDSIVKIANEYNLEIIEDVAEAPGAKYRGKYLGNFGKLACFSFFANKIYTTGEGGMILTNDENLYDKILSLRDHGFSKYKKYLHERLGFNYRMTNMQAALGIGQIERNNEISIKRRKQEELYYSNFSHSKHLQFRPKADWSDSVHWLMTIKLNKIGIRDRLIDYLKENMIDSRQMINPVNQALHFKKAHNYSFPISENISYNSLHLPSSNLLSEDQIEYISNKVIKWLKVYG